MASKKRVSRTSGNKKITIGRQLGSVVLDQGEANGVLYEEESPSKKNHIDTDSVFRSSTRTPETLNTSITIASMLNKIRQSASISNEKRFFSMSPDIKKETSADMDARFVLCKSTSSEDDEGAVCTDTKQNSSDKKTTTTDKVKMVPSDATFNVPSAKVGEGKKVQLEQRISQTWELPNFTANLHHYLDNESKYLDENEAAPVRTSLIQIGEQIDLHSTFIANLYLSRWDTSDVNQNQEGKVNLNLTKGPKRESVSYEASTTSTPATVENSLEEVFVMVTIKLVDIISHEQPAVDLHYQVNLKSSNGLQIVSFVHFLTHMKVGPISSVAEQINMKRLFSKMAPEDSLIINLHCSVYRPLIQWGLQSSEAKELVRLMLDGKVERENRKSVYSLIEKCNKFNLQGIRECLESLIPHKYFDD